MTSKIHHAPKGFSAITPYLIVEDAERLLVYVKQAFDAVEIECAREEGLIRHALVRITDAMLEFSNSRAPWQPMPGAIHLYVPDSQTVYDKAVAAGGTSLFTVTDMPYGERSGGVQDPCGNHWYIATRTQDGY